MEHRLPFRVRNHRELFGNYHSHNIFHFFQEEEKKLPTRRQKVTALKRDNVHVELQPPILVAQIISLLPACGCLEPDPKDIKFKWRNYRVFYCLVVIFFELAFSILTLNKYVRDGVSTRSIGDFLFYSGSLFTSFMFLQLARDWKDFIGQWITVQNTMNDLEPLSVRNKIKFVTLWLGLFSILEHLLSNSETFLNFGDAEGDRLNMFLETRHQQVFGVFSYSPFFGMLVYFTNVLITMIWNYTDIFLTTVSLALGKMFKQFTLDLSMTANDITYENSLSYWKKRREIYSRLSLLVKLVDDKLTVLILYSFGINLYYICIQLLNSLNTLSSLSNFIYFTSSFSHLLCRICAVCFSASTIYDNSKEPLPIIFSVPTEFYNIEVQRLQMQVSSETLALTGCNFFTVTRTLMLTVAGTIVTYEIVLVQFSSLGAEDCKLNPANETLAFTNSSLTNA